VAPSAPLSVETDTDALAGQSSTQVEDRRPTVTCACVLSLITVCGRCMIRARRILSVEERLSVTMACKKVCIERRQRSAHHRV